MEKGYVLSVTTLLLVLIIVTSADLEVRGTSKNTADTKNVETLNKSNGGNDIVVDPEAKGNDQVGGGSKEKVGINTDEPNKNGASKQLGVKDGGDKQKKENDSGSNEGGGKKEKVRGGSDSGSIKGTPVRKEGLRGEECDSSSISCTIPEKALVACLRVPGNESPDLSLLIQNKGKETVSVSISAPPFVQLEKRKFQLQEKENNKVKVSIGKGGIDNTITLRVGSGNCSLDFKDLVTQGSSKEGGSHPQFAFTTFFKSRTAIWFVLFAVFLIIASVWVFISFRRKHFARSGSRYEKLEMELPVSTDMKRDVDSNDGWDNSWDDNWDDEEAPKTPPMPVTPSLSSKGIASRRPNKEGWKD